MSFAEILFIAAGLAADAFAVALASSAAGNCRPGAVFRMSAAFGTFQAAMPLAGWGAGKLVAETFAAVDHWVAFGLLVFVGTRMLWPKVEEEGTECADPSSGWTLLALAVATSIDAFAVGLSLAMLRVGIWYPAGVIGLVTAGLVVVGFWLGGKLKAKFGRFAECFGGMLLIGIGVKIVLEHAMGL
ncbi:MAG: manganese efflux pump [Deltaproteobacteria bacterium]|nr:MAG: manganese efflux pump [Deltaproteobacteria bacterium]